MPGQPPSGAAAHRSSGTPATSRPHSCAMIPVDGASPQGGASSNWRSSAFPRKATGSGRCSSIRVGRVLGGRRRRRYGRGTGRQSTLTDISTSSASTRAESATPPRSCGAAPTPSSTRGGASRWPTTARPASRTSRRSTNSSSTAACSAWARIFWPPSEPRRSPATWTPSGGDRRRPDQLPGVLLRHRVGTAYVDHSATTCAPWCSTAPSTRASARRKNVRRWPRSSSPSTTTRPTARSTSTARWAGSREVGGPLPPVGRPARDRARTHLRSAWPELRGRDHRHRQRAVHPDVLEVPDQWPGRFAARRRRRDLLALADEYQGRAADGRLPQSAGCVQRGALRRRPGTRPIPRCGLDADKRNPAGRAVHRHPASSRGHAPRDICAFLAGTSPPRSEPGDPGGARPGRRRLHHPRPGHAVSGGRGPGPPARTLSLITLRRHAAHRGVQRSMSASTRRS